ncbi:MAG: GAF domain-containing protein [Anaerolineaceae bacterium]|nr:GAF domain-containing protein [Anaerolineaceae bacterium]
MSQISESEIKNVRRIIRLLDARLRKHIDADYLQDLLKQISSTTELLIANQSALPERSRLDSLYDVTKMIGTSLDLDIVLQQVMDACIRLTGAERGFLMLLNDDGQPEIKVARQFDQTNLTSDEVQYSSTIVNYAIDHSEGVLTSNASEDPRFSGQSSIVNLSLRSIMAFPLMARGIVLGAVYVENQLSAGLFSRDDLNFLGTIAGQAAVAIDNAKLFSETDAELTHRVEQLRDLRRIDQKLSGIVEFEEVAMTLMETACRLASVSQAYMGQTVSEGGSIRLILSYRTDGKVETQDDSSPTPINLSTTYPELKDAWASGKDSVLADAEGNQLLCVPLLRDGKTFAVIVLIGNKETAFTDDQRDMLVRLAARAAITLENARLYAAVKAADRSKSEFVGIVAHDLKSPMSSVRGYAELLHLRRNDIDAESIDRYSQRILSTVDHMTALVSDLSDISRIESGSFYIEPEAVNVYDLVETVQNTVMPEIRAREHEWITDLGENMPKIQADFYRLVQILSNLISNAYKYTPNGGKITLKVHEEGGRIQFAVEDTGIGMNEDQLANLGKRFWRSDDDYTRSQPGTGLGLAITQSIILQMGDRLRVTSEPGKGTCFSFSLPVSISGSRP